MENLQKLDVYENKLDEKKNDFKVQKEPLSDQTDESFFRQSKVETVLVGGFLYTIVRYYQR